MSAEVSEEAHYTDNQFIMACSEDSEEEISQEEQPGTPWCELSIVERVGLDSVAMSEKEVEAAVSQIALAFCCDQYTLKQRLQAEEHARNLAEENIQLELTRGRETLEALKTLCLDSKRSRIIQKLELCLDILGGTVDRIFNTAEVLGAVHQEARVSRAVELMVAHMETLKRQHDRDVAELKEAKRLIQKNFRRKSSGCRELPDTGGLKDKKDKKTSQQPNCRHRVSMAIITKQERRKRELKNLSGCPDKKALATTQTSESSSSMMTKDAVYSMDDRSVVEPGDTPSEASAVPLEPSPIPAKENHSPPPDEVAVMKPQTKKSPLDALRQRHKGKVALSKKKTDRSRRSVHVYQHPFMGLLCMWRRCSLYHWLHRCQWALPITMHLLVLLCVIITLVLFFMIF